MLNLDQSVVYDIETFPNCMTMNVVGLFSALDITFEISEYRDDRRELLAWFAYWQQHRIPMVGYNNLGFDYPVIHQIFLDPEITYTEIYDFAMDLIEDFTPFRQVWETDRFAPQIDLFKIHHFDNRAKSTSLKALQVNMRSESVMECPIPFGTRLTKQQIDDVVVPYNRHDVKETKKFALISLDAIKFRLVLSATLHGDVVNWNDTKIGGKILESRLGDELCYTREFDRRVPRQTIRHAIPLDEIIFPYITFREPEFNRILSWMRQQTLTADELTESIKTKGVFTGVHATVGGLDFYFGTGGIHGSVSSQRFTATDDRAIVDIDVAGLYPAIAIENRLYPEHLGERFIFEYAQLPKERALYKKGTTENSSLKLAGNGTYGNSNNKYSVFYDPRFTMAITINGQLLLCMLAESLLAIPTVEIIQINTDGITYRIHPSLIPYSRRVQGAWETLTRLKLEDARYSRMWIRDVNNYVAETTDGKLKQKGAYWFPNKFPDDISNSSPPAWHKDFSAMVTTMAAVANMVHGTDIERFVLDHGNQFDFMCRAKVDRSSNLMIGETEVQRLTRYYVAREGGHMKKISPPIKGARVGEFKRKSGISDSEWACRTVDVWDSRFHTKNKSKYEIREMSIESGFQVAECNVASRFDFNNVNYDWYVDKARKLVI